MSRRRKPPVNPRRISPTKSLVFVLVALVVFFVARSGLLETIPQADTSARPATLTTAPVEQVTAPGEPGATDAAGMASEATPAPVAAPAEPVASAMVAATPVSPTPTANAPPAQASATATRASNLPTVAYADLPPAAHDTIRLIEQGGPFPFDRDGITFQNRERRLPLRPQGYYREYTVITPGVRTRGARRIVTGQGGEMYYTDDHYDSFREIVR